MDGGEGKISANTNEPTWSTSTGIESRWSMTESSEVCETHFTECLVRGNRGNVVSVVSASSPPLPRPHMQRGLLAIPPGWRSRCAQDVYTTPPLVAVQQNVLQRSASILDKRCNRHSTTQYDLLIARPPPSDPEIILAVARAQEHLPPQTTTKITGRFARKKRRSHTPPSVLSSVGRVTKTT